MNQHRIKDSTKISAHLASTKPLHLDDINGCQHLALHRLGHPAGVEVSLGTNLGAHLPGALEVAKPPDIPMLFEGNGWQKDERIGKIAKFDPLVWKQHCTSSWSHEN